MNHVTPACATGNCRHCSGWINPRKTRPIECWCTCGHLNKENLK